MQNKTKIIQTIGIIFRPHTIIVYMSNGDGLAYKGLKSIRFFYRLQ